MRDEQEILSPKEEETLRLLLVGHDAKSIARTLGLSVHTINDRLRDARRKLGVSSSREAARRLAERDRGTPNFVVPEGIGGVEADPAMERVEGPVAPRPPGHRLAWLTGGMLIMSLLIAAASLLIMNGRESARMPTQNVSTSISRPAETKASADARRWIELLDNGQWEASWRGAGKLFREKVTSVQWSEVIQSVRQPLGRPLSRILISAARTKVLAGAPMGDYQILRFQTDFEGKRSAVETVIVSAEQGGWHVNGYFIL